VTAPDILLATGGTGGHIYPAVAIAQEATNRGYLVSFIGQKGGMEETLVPKEGFSFHGVSAGKWDRERPRPSQAFKASKGLIEAVVTVARLNPSLTVGFGGFASFPGLAASRLLGIPYVLHEGNAYPGKVIRWFAKGAKFVGLSHESAKSYLKQARRFELVGFPIREARVDKARARRALGLPQDGVVTLVMGGSQGSQLLNTCVPEAFSQLSSPPIVLHSTGQRWLETVQAAHPGLQRYYTVGFVDATLAWSAADLAITRAGIGTLAEAAFHGVPTIMVPLSTAAENHQLHNARAVAAAGAGWVVEETQLDTLAAVWQKALGDEVRSSATAAAKRLSPAGAARAFVDLIEPLLPPRLARGALQESL
jgi:UDP-N-acetylglucosamine--N-acetylmuramyl-(pentapeptide) pyrophosphoryl-undecaprenol N-acetylglucosamine transferase